MGSAKDAAARSRSRVGPAAVVMTVMHLMVVVVGGVPEECAGHWHEMPPLPFAWSLDADAVWL